MLISELQKNVETEIKMLKEISNYTARLDYASDEEAKLLLGSIESLKEGMRIITDSIPRILKKVSAPKTLPTLPKHEIRKEPEFENVSFKGTGQQYVAVLDSKDKTRFLKELSINESLLKKLKKRKKRWEEEYEEFKGARGYLKLANKFFLQTASKWVRQGRFKELGLELKKANLDILFESYIALLILNVVLSFGVFLILGAFFLFFDVSITSPFVSVFAGNYLIRLAKVILLPIVGPILVFLATYYYPLTEKKSIRKKIDQELPFAVIHMSAISGSGIEPSEIFKIIGLSRDYPYLRKEIRKVMNQINLYGYDLVTALNNASKTSPSEKLGELLAGLSVTITSGASLSQFFEKRAESLLLAYRLEREKYTKAVETFLDIYISVVITAPLIFLLLIVMMGISGIGVTFTPVQMSVLSVVGVVLLNVVFLVFLQIKQPTY